jgi:hypothetical protein
MTTGVFEMTRNVGSVDKILRVVAGLALILFAVTGLPATGYNWLGWIGVAPLATTLVGWCPAYSLFGLSTCPMTGKGA